MKKRSGEDGVCVKKRSREDGVCVEKAHVAVAVSGKPARDRSCWEAEHQCVWSTWGVTGGARVREVHVVGTHVLERREARARSGRAVVDALQGSRDPFLFLLFGLCVNDCGKAPVGDM